MIVSSEDIKQSIVENLIKHFPDIVVYKEVTAEPIYPNFFINLIEISSQEQRKNFFILTYSFDIRYRNVNDPTTDLKLQQHLDTISFELLHDFDIIDFEFSKVRVKNKQCKVIDGVLHFLFAIDLYVVKVSDEPILKMDRLKLDVLKDN